MNTPETKSFENPYDTPEYQQFVSEMAKHCDCAERFKPCDGVLAGGVCDQIKDERDEPPQFDNDESCAPIERCNVCGRELMRSDEKAIGACAVCMNES